MNFNSLFLQINRGRMTSATQGGDGVTVTHSYKDISLTVGNIISILPPYLDQGASQDMVFVDDCMMVVGSDTTFLCKILALNPFTLGPDLFAGAAGLTIGAPVAATDANALKITAQTLQAEIADATHPGIVTIGAQSIAGIKTFTNQANIDGSNIASARFSFADPKVYLDNKFQAGNRIQFMFSEDDLDSLVYELPARTFSYNTNNTPRFGVGTNFTYTTNLMSLPAGLQFTLVPSVDQSTMEDYQEYDYITTLTMGTEVTVPVTFKIIRVGKQVTITCHANVTTPAQVGPGNEYNAAVAIPARFRPTHAVYGHWLVNNNMLGEHGSVLITTLGEFDIRATADGVSSFDAGVVNGFYASSITYNIT